MRGETPLTLAAKADLVENVKTLLEHESFSTQHQHRNDYPLLLAEAIRARSYEMAYSLIARGAWVEQICQKKGTFMQEAATKMALYVNVLLTPRLSDKYMDMRRSTLYFAVSRDIPCVEMLLNAGAKLELDPLCCLLVAVRAGRYAIVKLLLARQADVNCYFTVVSNTVLPPTLHYCLQDEMMCLLLNNGYDVERCFTCNHDDSLSMKCVEEEGIPFCEFMSLSCLMHLSGCVVRILLHYVSHVHISSQFKLTLEEQKEWPDICDILGKRSLKHLCLEIRKQLTLKRLNDHMIGTEELLDE
ncbi:LOW QUALITY PROTEIN: ankyrin repeat and SOCS box protein 15-like [Salvelinus alpinus]